MNRAAFGSVLKLFRHRLNTDYQTDIAQKMPKSLLTLREIAVKRVFGVAVVRVSCCLESSPISRQNFKVVVFIACEARLFDLFISSSLQFHPSAARHWSHLSTWR